MSRSPLKIWRPTPQYNRSRRLARCINIELDSPEQREELKARAAEKGVSMNAYTVALIAADLRRGKL
jgi:hypothetical protein